MSWAPPLLYRGCNMSSTIIIWITISNYHQRCQYPYSHPHPTFFCPSHSLNIRHAPTITFVLRTGHKSAKSLYSSTTWSSRDWLNGKFMRSPLAEGLERNAHRSWLGMAMGWLREFTHFFRHKSSMWKIPIDQWRRGKTLTFQQRSIDQWHFCFL